MEAMREEFDAYAEEDRNVKKILIQKKLAHIEALKEEVAAMKKLLKEREHLAQDKEDQLKAFQSDRNIAQERIMYKKQELELKLKEIEERNARIIQQKENVQAAKKILDEKRETKKKKNETLPEDPTPAISEELQAEYQEQIKELKNRMVTIVQEILEIVKKNKDFERLIEEALEEGRDISNHKEELSQQMTNLRANLLEMSKEKNKLLKEKEDLEEQLKLSKMSDHSEKGNSMIAEIEDGNQIMARNLKIVNHKCSEVKKRIALKKFELGKLKESYANLLYDLKKKNNYSNSAYGVLQEEIDEYKKKFKILEAKMSSLANMEEKEPFPASNDDMKCLNTMFISKKKAMRETVKECQEVVKKTFVKRETVFQLEYDFRNLKSELREWQNRITRKKEELKIAMVESEKKDSNEMSPSKEEINVQKSEEGQETRDTNVAGIKKHVEEEVSSNDHSVDDSQNVLKTEHEKSKEENTLNAGGAPSDPEQDCPGEQLKLNENSLQIDDIGSKCTSANSSNSIGNMENEQSKENLSPAKMKSNISTKSNDDSIKNSSSEVMNASSFIDEEILLSKFKNVNNSLAKVNLASDVISADSLVGNDSSIDEDSFPSRFKNVNSSIRKEVNTGEGMFGDGANLANELMNAKGALGNESVTQDSLDETSFMAEHFRSKFKNVNNSLNRNDLASELMFANKENDLASELMFANKENDLASELMFANKENDLASELMFANKENNDLSNM